MPATRCAWLRLSLAFVLLPGLLRCVCPFATTAWVIPSVPVASHVVDDELALAFMASREPLGWPLALGGARSFPRGASPRTPESFADEHSVDLHRCYTICARSRPRRRTSSTST